MSVNNSKLMEVAQKSETAANILDFVSERRRNTVYTAFSGLRADIKKKYGKAVNRKEFDAAFQELQSIGAGKVDKSKRGTFLGFTWSIPIRQIATLIKNKDEVGAVGMKVEKAKVIKSEVSPEDAALAKELAKKVTLVIIRRNRAPETIQTDEARLRLVSSN